jgi:integrase
MQPARRRLTCADSGSILRWNNHKAKHYSRRLPILQTTADAIRQWIDMRSQLNVPGRSDSYLFPSVAKHAGEPYIRSYSFSHCIRLWIDGLERLVITNVDPTRRDRGTVRTTV